MCPNLSQCIILVTVCQQECYKKRSTPFADICNLLDNKPHSEQAKESAPRDSTHAYRAVFGVSVEPAAMTQPVDKPVVALA